MSPESGTYPTAKSGLFDEHLTFLGIDSPYVLSPVFAQGSATSATT